MSALQPTAATPQTELMGVTLDALTEQQTIDSLLAALSAGRGGWVCPINLDVLRQIKSSPEILELVMAAELRVADGAPLIWASRLGGGEPLPERVAGSSLVRTLTAACAGAGRTVFLLGGNPGAAGRAAERLRAESPALQIAGTACPALGFEADPAARAEIDETLRSSKPDVVYLALGFPKQDRLARELRDSHPGMWFISCGISLSFAAGDIQRAPGVLQRLGLEWLHRLAQEPRRLGRRYLLQGPPFLFRLLGWAVIHRLGARRRLRPSRGE